MSTEPQQWAIAHESGPETQKRRVFGRPSQTLNHHGTPKMWAIGHEKQL
jgi:hypothetical protein